MPKFLLDANLSPKHGRYLSMRFGLDVESLLTRGLGELSDHEVLRLAKSSGRVVITLDRDFAPPTWQSAPSNKGSFTSTYRTAVATCPISNGFSANSSNINRPPSTWITRWLSRGRIGSKFTDEGPAASNDLIDIEAIVAMTR